MTDSPLEQAAREVSETWAKALVGSYEQVARARSLHSDAVNRLRALLSRAPQQEEGIYGPNYVLCANCANRVKKMRHGRCYRCGISLSEPAAATLYCERCGAALTDGGYCFYCEAAPSSGEEGQAGEPSNAEGQTAQGGGRQTSPVPSPASVSEQEREPNPKGLARLLDEADREAHRGSWYAKDRAEWERIADYLLSHGVRLVVSPDVKGEK